MSDPFPSKDDDGWIFFGDHCKVFGLYDVYN